MGSLLRTPLFEFHTARGARMVEFSGWEMPVQYRSILEEHKVVRSTAGLFDVSHMGEVTVKGLGARSFINFLVTNDVGTMKPGRVVYSPMCYPNGGVVDDLLVYCRGSDDFLLCINAGNVDKDIAWILEKSEAFDCTVTNRSAEFGLLALQGPKSLDIVGGLTTVSLEELGYYHFAEGTVAGIDCLISRTGYTGEQGVELFCPSGRVVELAEKLLATGEPSGLALAGLGARDGLRLEAGFSLYGHEISTDISPIEAGLNWTVKFNKGCDFVGREALLAQKVHGPARRVLFFRTGDRRIVRADSPVLAGEKPVGKVLSGTLSPVLNEAIGSMLVESEAGDGPFYAEIRGQRIALNLTKPPFVPLKK